MLSLSTAQDIEYTLNWSSLKDKKEQNLFSFILIATQTSVVSLDWTFLFENMCCRVDVGVDFNVSAL